MTESTSTFTVTADAERHIRAERATIRARISARSEHSKDEAYNAVQAVHSRLEAQARAFRQGGHAAPATWHHASAPSSYSIREEFKGDDKEIQSRTVFITASVVTVKFQNFETMSDWLAELAGETLVASLTPEWTLTEKTRKDAESGVRTQAVKNARAYAADFAAGDDIDASALRLVSVDASVKTGYPYAAAGATRGSAGGSAAFAVTPNEVTVSASVTATFETTEV
jgi:uncharacterized protein YggE